MNMKQCSKCTKKKSVSTTQDSDGRKFSRIVKASSVVKLTSKPIQTRVKHELTRAPKEVYKVNKPESKQSLIPLCNELLNRPPSQKNERNDANIRINDLERENRELRERYCALEQSSLAEKEKVKRLLMRVNELKSSSTEGKKMQTISVEGGQRQLDALFTLRTNQSNVKQQNTPLGLIHSRNVGSSERLKTSTVCASIQCQQQRRNIQQLLYKERLCRDKLEAQKKEWLNNKDRLKAQYNQLLQQLQDIKDQDFL